LDKPLVSVAIATYNGEKYLREQVESILAQSYRPIQVVVTDDCSTDGTRQILEEYQKQGHLSFQINENRLGYVKNFEKAILLCDGDFIALADQDDVWERNKIEELVNNISDYFLIHSDAKLINSDGEKIEDSYTEFSKKMVNPKYIKHMLLNGSVTGCTSLCRKDFLIGLLPFPEGLYIHDKWMGIFAFLQNGLKYYKQPLISYRQHLNNNIGALNPNKSIWVRLNKLFTNYRNIKAEPVRKNFEKEYKLVELVLLHGQLNKKDQKSAKEVFNFYQRVLSGENLISVVYFFLTNFSIIENNKPFSQKLYFFTLVMMVYFGRNK
jgi:glycosyltransferase involved in cell wall biosynthesis